MVKPVVVVDYDPNWPELFAFLSRRIAGSLGGIAAAVEHNGSAAAPGLVSKPIVDIDVLLVSETSLPAAIDHLAVL